MGRAIHTIGFSASAAKNGLTVTAGIADANGPFTVSTNDITLLNRTDQKIIAALAHQSVTASKAHAIGIHGKNGSLGKSTAPAVRLLFNETRNRYIFTDPLLLSALEVLNGYSDNTNTNEVSQFFLLIGAEGIPHHEILPKYKWIKPYYATGLTAGAGVWTTAVTFSFANGQLDSSKEYDVLGVMGQCTDGGCIRFPDPEGKIMWKPGAPLTPGASAAVPQYVKRPLWATEIGTPFCRFKGSRSSISIDACDSAGNADVELELWIGEHP